MFPFLKRKRPAQPSHGLRMGQDENGKWSATATGWGVVPLTLLAAAALIASLTEFLRLFIA